MAVPTSHDPSIEAALDQWRQWTLGDTYERPALGELLGEGSANRVYELPYAATGASVRTQIA